MTKELKQVAFDGGNGTAGIKTEDGEWIIPALGYKLPPENRERTYRKYLYIFEDRSAYVLGDPDVSLESAVQIGRIPERYYNGTTLRFLLALLYTAYPNEESIEIEELRMCVPLSVYNDISNDEKIKGCFEGEHIVNGTKVNIKRVFISPEGGIALYNLPLYTHGAKVLIIDIGFSTTDVVLADNGGVDESASVSYPVGIGNLDADRKKILTKPKDYANSYEVQRGAEELVSKLNRKYSDFGVDYVAVIGGGAYVYGEVLKNYAKESGGALQNANWLDIAESELANLEGMYA
jgi:hypothetical protein